MPYTPTTRSTRSNSNPSNNVTLSDIKSLIQNSKNEILDSFRNEMQGITTVLNALMNRVDELESKNVHLEQKCKLLEEKSADFTTSVLNEIEDRNRRKMNLIISGLPEHLDGSAELRRTADVAEVDALLRKLSDGVGVRFSHVRRIGSIASGKSRPICVMLSNETERRNFLSRAKQLRAMPNYRNVYINPDLTPSQREENIRLRLDLKAHRKRGDDVVIRNGKVVMRHKSENFL